MAIIYPASVPIRYESTLSIAEFNSKLKDHTKAWNYSAWLNGDAIAGKIEENSLCLRKACALYRGSTPQITASITSESGKLQIIGTINQSRFDYAFLIFFVICYATASFPRKTGASLAISILICVSIVIGSLFAIPLHRRKAIRDLESFLEEKLSAKKIAT